MKVHRAASASKSFRLATRCAPSGRSELGASISVLDRSACWMFGDYPLEPSCCSIRKHKEPPKRALALHAPWLTPCMHNWLLHRYCGCRVLTIITRHASTSGWSRDSGIDLGKSNTHSPFCTLPVRSSRMLTSRCLFDEW